MSKFSTWKKKSKWWSVTSKVCLDEMKRQGNLDNSVSISQWRNLYLKGKHSLRQNGTHTLSPRHVAKEEEDHGGAASPAPRSTGHQSCTGFLALLPAKCSHPDLGCSRHFLQWLKLCTGGDFMPHCASFASFSKVAQLFASSCHNDRGYMHQSL